VLFLLVLAAAAASRVAARPAVDISQQAENVGSTVVGWVSPASWSDSKIDICIRGVNNNIYEKPWTAGVWADWQDLGGTTPYTPSCLSWGEGQLDIYHTGDNGHLYHQWFQNGKWGKDVGDWENLGGNLLDGPSCTATGINQVACFGRQHENELWMRAWDGHRWNDWKKMASGITGQPACAASMTGVVDCFTRGKDNKVYTIQFSNGEPNAGDWTSLDGEVTDLPSVVKVSPAHVELMARGIDSKLWRRCRVDGKWFPWAKTDLILNSPVGAVQRGSSNTIDYFTVAQDGSAEHRTTLPLAADGTVAGAAAPVAPAPVTT